MASSSPEPTLGPVRIVPAVPPLEPGIVTHVASYGWSSDSERFGYCFVGDGRGDTGCVFAPREGGPKEKLSDWNDQRDEQDPVLLAKMNTRLRELALRAKSGQWAYAGDLEISWDVRETVLRVGARVRGHAPSFSILLRDNRDFDMDGGIHPDAIVVSPDGKWLGAISHTFHGEFTDAYEIGMVSVARAAAHAYNDAGYELHKASKWDAAAEFFRKGVDADPTFARPKYNLACAYARLGDPRAEPALRETIAAAGKDAAETKRKARADPDFAAVAREAWFEDALK